MIIIFLYFCHNNQSKTMKEWIFASMTGVVALLMVSCSGDGKYKAFAEEFATAVANGDRAAITRMYPDAEKAESLSVTYNADSLVITTDEAEKMTTLTLGKGIDLLVSENTDGGYVIQSSHGLFAYPAAELSFAKKTGQWKEGLTDAEQAERMADKGLADYLFEEFNNKVKSALSISSTGTWGDDYYEGEWVSSKGAVFKVKNSSSIDIPGNAWSIIYKEGYWGGGEMATEEVPGIDVKAGETVTVRTKKLGASMESETGQRLNIKGITKEEFMASFLPTGNEYDEYVKNNGKHKAVGESLSFLVEGLMGGWATRLSMDNNSGSLMYTTNSKELGVGENENRDVKLVSYDPSNGRLVLRVSRSDGTVTGDLVGTYKNGQYKGQFQNVNGKSSAFSFK
jgi:hypothetical protein